MGKKGKKRLTESEEFEILKLVLDKFLWLGFVIMAFGLFNVFNGDSTGGITWMVMGAIVLVLFVIIIVKEFEIL